MRLAILALDCQTVGTGTRLRRLLPWLQDAPRMLGEPVEGTLFFAGEATDLDGQNGTVHGAMASGRRAAGEVIEERHSSRSRPD